MSSVDPLSELVALGKITPLSFWRVCGRVLIDTRFMNGIASASHHPASHQVPGGLVVHTLEVAQEAVRMAGDDKLLASRAYVAAVFHDYGKIFDYEWIPTTQEVKKLPFGSRVGHVVWGWQNFNAVSLDSGMTHDDIEEIGHALLAHHGRKEWGSPVEPQTRLAHIIHTADMLSSRGLV